MFSLSAVAAIEPGKPLVWREPPPAPTLAEIVATVMRTETFQSHLRSHNALLRTLSSPR